MHGLPGLRTWTAFAAVFVACAPLPAGAKKADSVKPKVAIEAPAARALVSGGRVIVAATASDNVGIVGVQFKLDGANLGAEDRTAPYRVVWNSRSVPDGGHRLTATARDQAGNRSSDTVVVKVSNLTVALRQPVSGAAVSGRTALLANASGLVAGVQFKVDGVKLGAEISDPPYRIAWDTRFLQDGPHKVTVVAREAGGRRTASSVTVNVSNSTRIFAPVADTEVRADIPTVNFGTADTMGLGGSPVRIGYLRFNVDLPPGRVVKKATLNVFMTSASSADIFVRQVASTSWVETAVTYNNRPSVGGQVVASGPFSANSYLPIDLTGLVSGSGPVSIAVTRSNSVPLGFRSREAAAKPPLLVVETVAGSPYGSLPVGSAEYAVPSNAAFVSPSGSNSGSGSQSSPWLTIQHAINVLPSGRTIVVRQGVYHETVRIPSNRAFTIQAYPGEAVWLDGSTIVTGWVRSGSTWVKSGWTPSFNSTPGFNPSWPDYRYINPDYPMAAHPDQVWVDGEPLAQVASAGLVVAGTFYVDYAADRLVIGTDPTGRTVTASDLADGVHISGPGSKLLGVGVRKYATPTSHVATVRIAATNVTVENVVISQNANVGIVAARVNARLNKVTAERNGLLGVLGNEADNLIVTNLHAHDNNTENYNMSPVASGMKVTRTRGITIRDSLFANNNANGLWIDESSYDSKIVNNVMIGNRRNGISYEISSLAVIADNVFNDNHGVAIKINNATSLRIYNNTLLSSGQNLLFAQDERVATDLSIPGHDHRQPQPDPTVTWLLGNVEFKNNRVSSSTGEYLHGSGNNHYASYIRDYTGRRNCGQMNITLDGNLFEPQGPGRFMVWCLFAGDPALYSTVAAFQSGTGQGPGNGDNAASTVPVGLPSDIAELIGVPAGTRFVGAFE